MRKKLSKLAKKVLTPFSKTKSAILQSGLRNFKNVFALTALMAIAPSFVLSQTSKAQEESNIVYLEDLPKTKSTNTQDYTKVAIMDLYSQPNIHILNGKNKLDYYGSGDGNNDEKRDNLDLQLIQDEIDNPGTLTKDQRKRADVTGEGVINIEDYNTLNSFLTGQRLFLPGDWTGISKYSTNRRKDRVAWMTKRIKANIKYPIEGYLCGDHTRRYQLNFLGVENLENWRGFPVYKDYVENAKENIPVYFVFTTTIEGGSHAIPCFFAGSKDSTLSDDPTQFDQLYFFNYKYQNYDGEGNLKETFEVVPGDAVMNPNKEVKIRGFTYSEEDSSYIGTSIVDFQLNDSIPTLTYTSPFLLRENPNLIWIRFPEYPEVVRYNVGDIRHVSPLKEQVKTNSRYYKEDIIATHTISNKINVNPNYENYEFDYTVKDSAFLSIGRTSLITARTPYGVEMRDIEAPVFESADVNGELPRDTIIKEWPRDVVSPDNPDIGWPEVTDNSNLPIDIEWTLDLVDSKENYETYKIDYTAKDKSINENVSHAYQYIIKDLTVGSNDLKQADFKIYPNPTKGIINLEGKIDNYEKIYWELYDIKGSLINNGTKEYFPGDKERIDISNVKSGMYLLNVTAGDKTKGYKVLKE